MATKKKTSTPKKPQGPVTPEKFCKLVRPYMDVIARKPTTEAGRLAQFQAYHAMGAVVVDQLSSRSTYGENRMKEYGEATGIGKTNLDRAKRFSERYEKDKLQELAESGLTWSHFAHLAGVRDKVKRKRLQSQAARQTWTVGQLQSKIKAGKADSKRSASGRRLEIPNNAEEAYRKLRDDGNLFVRRLQGTTDKHSNFAELAVPEVLRNQTIDVLNQIIRAAKEAKQSIQ